MSSISPIRVGIIGLGRATKGTTMVPGVWAVNAHLPYLLASPKYQIVAVSNSSKESAAASIKTNNLGDEVKAYGSPQEIANDPNIDLVVVSVRIAHHYDLAKPSLEAGKEVFVEWPLGATTAQAVELAQLAKAKGVKTMVGLQARASPLVIKLKEIIESGKIGKVLSSTVNANFMQMQGKWAEGAEYYLDINSGANQFVVFFGHFLDTFTHILGPFTTLSASSKVAVPTNDIVSPTGEIVKKDYPVSRPDHVFVLGSLSSSATASLSFVTAPAGTADGAGMKWVITGTEGQIIVETPPEKQWQMIAGDPRSTLTVKIGAAGKIEKVDYLDGLAEEDVLKEMGFPGANTGRQYKAFGEGDVSKYPDFEGAVENHKLLDWIRREAGF